MSTFIFTSHLHELTKLEEVKRLENLSVYHLRIDYDEEKDILIYDRKLADRIWTFYLWFESM